MPRYSTINIPRLEDKTAEWERLGASAVEMLNAIDGKGRYTDRFMRSFTLGSMDSMIDRFGEGFDL